ncbi:hypothetical protein BRC19_01315 [Candidatus Saccharibacteria bacterium QS_5_54_17]|nr:MAG: hypothetical protein BRC19_01315 [Candidatus Saccharibacteria bacterium QS_5_54_17]
MKLTDDFKQAVFEVVRQIPQGRVMTYGDVAVAAGAPGAAWEVGQIAHWAPCRDWETCDSRMETTGTLSPDVPLADICPACDLPWQRVVNKQGGLARGYPYGGLDGHKRELESEGVTVGEEYKVDINNLMW